jgi:outer membrane protein
MRRVGLLLVLVAAHAHADPEVAYAPPDFMTTQPPLPAAIDASSAWRLDLAEALRIAVHDNHGLVMERESVVIARLGRTVADGTFEPLLAASYSHSSSDSPPVSIQQGVPGQILTFVDDAWKLSLTQRLSTGMRLEVDFVNDRSRSSAGTAVEPLVYNSSAFISVTQPLLRGFSTDRVIPRIDVLRAKLASEHERQQLLVAADEVIEKTEDAYWDVVQALYRYDLELRSRQRADEQIALTKRQIAAGLMPPSDLISAESTHAQRELQLVQAEEAINQAWDALRGTLNLPRDQWTRPIVPTDMPQFVAEDHSPEEALQIAIKHRPELAQLELELETQALAVRKAENDQLPQIDLGLSGGVLGQDSNYRGALREFGRADATAYTLMLNLSWTPLQRATRANADIERAHQRVVRVRRDQSVQTIWLAVRDAVRNQRSAARQVAAAAKFRGLSTESLEVEQRKFLSGTSSNFVVAQRQEELANAQLAELSAVLGHKKATAALLRATGELLDARHVELDVRK